MIVWVDQRFSAWGRWKQMGHGLGSKGLSANWGAIGGGSSPGAFVPVKDIECSRTDDWVRTLERDQQAIMLQVYCTPHSSREHARLLKCSLRTLYARLHSLQVAYTRRQPGHKVQSTAAQTQPTPAK